MVLKNAISITYKIPEIKLLCLAHDIMGQTNSLLTKKKNLQEQQNLNR